MIKEALMMSISHWQENLSKTKNKIFPSIHSEDCALCILYEMDDCEGCPIFKKGFKYCHGTPYDLVALLKTEGLHKVMSGSELDDVFWENIEMATQKELKFLESLKDV